MFFLQLLLLDAKMTYLPFQWDSFIALLSLSSISYLSLTITLTSACQHIRTTETQN